MKGSIKKRKVLVVDDHPVTRSAIAYLVAPEAELSLCGQAGTIAEAAALLKSEKPDIVITDISLPDGNGVDFIRTIRKEIPGAAVLVFSMHEESSYALRAFKAGANGYVMKTEPLGRLLEAITKIIKGGLVISEAYRDELLLQLLETEQNKDFSPAGALSDRELEIFHMLGEGRTSRQIADKMNLSVKTVQAYRERIKSKLKIENANALIQQAVQWVSGGVKVKK